MFQLNASVVIRAKVKNSTKTPHFIVRYWGTCQWMSLEFKCQRELAVLQYTTIYCDITSPHLCSVLTAFLLLRHRKTALNTV